MKLVTIAIVVMGDVTPGAAYDGAQEAVTELRRSTKANVQLESCAISDLVDESEE